MEENINVNVEETKETVQEEVTEKTFTQSELEEILSKRLAKEKKKIETEREKSYQAQLKAQLEESERLAQMNEADRVKAKAEKERKQFEEEKRNFQEQMRMFEKEKIQRQTMQMLGERNMPVELAQFITSENADEIMENVTIFEEHFNKCVEKIVTERLKSKAPNVSTVSNKGYTMDQLKNMSADEINKNWSAIKNNLK